MAAWGERTAVLEGAVGVGAVYVYMHNTYIHMNGAWGCGDRWGAIYARLLTK